MVYKGNAEIRIPQNMYEAVTVEVKNADVKNISLSLSPMESRCSHCHEPLIESEEILTLINSYCKGTSLVSLSSQDVFLIHKKCLEDFIVGFLNPPIDLTS